MGCCTGQPDRTPIRSRRRGIGDRRLRQFAQFVLILLAPCFLPANKSAWVSEKLAGPYERESDALRQRVYVLITFPCATQQMIWPPQTLFVLIHDSLLPKEPRINNNAMAEEVYQI